MCHCSQPDSFCAHQKCWGDSKHYGVGGHLHIHLLPAGRFQKVCHLYLKHHFFCNSEPRKAALETKLYEADSPWPFLQVKTKSLLAVENKLASQVRSVHVVSVTALCLSGLSSAWLRFHLHCGAVLTFIICCFILFWMWTPYLSIGFFKTSPLSRSARLFTCCYVFYRCCLSIDDHSASDFKI